MDSETLFVIVLIILAVFLFGSTFMTRRRATDSSGEETFKDCFDLCARETRRDSTACNTMCAIKPAM